MAKPKDAKLLKLLFEMWQAWSINKMDGDDVFAVFGDRIKAALAPVLNK